MLATAVVWWPWYARLVRGQALHLKHEAFVDAARVSGASAFRITTQHILRNCLTPIIVQMSLDIGYAILTLASLSFIGLGAQPPMPEWGSMVSLGRDYFLEQWWMVTFPGLAIFSPSWRSICWATACRRRCLPGSADNGHFTNHEGSVPKTITIAAPHRGFRQSEPGK